ncbi:MAG: hypothetical protein PWQ79_617 [Thermococcaceae archaeon]|nr:hypothetical protein [Thermococcaceae archaeon]
MEGGLMKRRGFFINSAAIVLLIPLLLLAATYEDVSSLIVHSQSERTQTERAYNVVTFLSLEFQRAMEISGKRAVVSAVDYVAVTGNFINPDYGANQTIADLIREGDSSSLRGYNVSYIMREQTLRVWLSNVTKILRNQGFEISPSIEELADSTEITVAPLDAFTIVIKARIPHIEIRDASGTVVYNGPIPSTGEYVYSRVDIRDLEDPFHSVMTRGKYHRSIRACKYAFPEISPPITVANGTGSGDEFVLGRFGRELMYNLTHIWDSEGNYITYLTINGKRVPSKSVVREKGDMGVIVFGDVPSGDGEMLWCSQLDHRLNITLQNNGVELINFQVPVYIDSAHTTRSVLETLFSVADGDQDGIPIMEVYDDSCNRINFWVEEWDWGNLNNDNDNRALIWLNVTLPALSSKTVSIYFGSSGTESLGDASKVFDFFDDFETWQGWSNYSNGAVYQSSEQAYDGIYSLKKDERNDPNGGYKLIGKTIGRGYILEGYVYRPRNWRGGSQDRLGLEDSNNDGYTMGVVHNNNQNRESIKIDIRDNGGADGSWSISTSVPEDEWYFFRMIFDNPQITFQIYTQGSAGWALRYLTTSTPYAEVPASDTTYNSFDRVVIHGGYEYYVDSLRIRKYATVMPSATVSSSVELKPSTGGASIGGSVYDLQPLIDCIQDQRYFAIEDGWSFFERLEGSDENHEDYVALAHEMQDELNYKPPVGYYPIGLVSFMVPHANYDEKLFNLMRLLEIPLEEGQSSVDYYFLKYYFGGGSKVDGYRVWGISQGDYYNIDLGTSVYLSRIPLFLDVDTAKVILGTQGACQLLDGYTCP